MAAVMAPVEIVREALKPVAARVSIAALNGPRQTVISGPGEDVKALLTRFSAAGVKFRELVVSHAFHSPLMDPVLEPFENAAANVSFSAPRLRLVSNLTGQVTSAAEMIKPAYWRRQIRETVQYAASMRTLADAGCTVFLEIGPNPVLLGLGRGCIDPEGALWLASLRSGRDDWAEMLASLSQLYVHGMDIDWAGFDRDYPRHKVSLPTYPFQRERYFVDREIQRAGRLATAQALHPLAERFIDSPSLKGIVFETSLSAASHRFLEDHRVFGRIIFPATGYLESVRAAARLGCEFRLRGQDRKDGEGCGEEGAAQGRGAEHPAGERGELGGRAAGSQHDRGGRLPVSALQDAPGRVHGVDLGRGALQTLASSDEPRHAGR